MGYVEALEAAGAIVHDSEYFGSYQGEALADVTYEGRRGILAYGFGSCSGCDSWEAFEGYGEREKCSEHDYVYDGAIISACSICKQTASEWSVQVAIFGRDMLNGVMYGDEITSYRDRLAEQGGWDYNAPAQLRWLDARIATFA